MKALLLSFFPWLVTQPTNTTMVEAMHSEGIIRSEYGRTADQTTRKKLTQQTQRRNQLQIQYTPETIWIHRKTLNRTSKEKLVETIIGHISNTCMQYFHGRYNRKVFDKVWHHALIYKMAFLEIGKEFIISCTTS